jgi:hypothetical protein
LAGSQGRSLPVINRSAFPALIFTRDVFDWQTTPVRQSPYVQNYVHVLKK